MQKKQWRFKVGFGFTYSIPPSSIWLKSVFHVANITLRIHIKLFKVPSYSLEGTHRGD